MGKGFANVQDDDLNRVIDGIARLVASGLYTARELTEIVSRDYVEYDRAFLAGALDAAIASYAEEAKSWPVVTDYVRLTAALAAVEKTGILVMHSAGRDKGPAEQNVNAAWDYLGRTSSGKYGYVFYTEEDVQYALADGKLELVFACFERHSGVFNMPFVQELMGHGIVQALRAEGLNVRWSGRNDDKIIIDMKWQKEIPRKSVERPYSSLSKRGLDSRQVNDWDFASLNTEQALGDSN